MHTNSHNTNINIHSFKRRNYIASLFTAVCDTERSGGVVDRDRHHLGRRTMDQQQRRIGEQSTEAVG